MTKTTDWYDANADEIVADYEKASPADIHGWLVDLLPSKPGVVLDVGAGSGRDAAWLARMGHEVIAAEPSSEMRSRAKALHPDLPIRWLADSLPGLANTFKTGLSFDFILLSAVWFHIPPSERTRSFRKLVSLIKPGGVIALTLRVGPDKSKRGFFPVSTSEIETLARDHGAFVVRQTEADDHLGRDYVHWIQIAIRLPDDGTGALPLLRHIVLNDDKSSTYKLALLRSLCRIADGYGGLVRDHDGECVAIPMGMVALAWLRLYKPLLAANIPQSSTNRGYCRLSFVKEAFQRLREISPQDMRIGMRFSDDLGKVIHQALKDAARTITAMPAKYLTHPDGTRILKINRNSAVKRPSEFRLDEAYLASFGEMFVPVHLWRALQRFNSWIEPALVAEWVRLAKSYATRQGRSLENAHISTAMLWSEPTRDVQDVRAQANRLLAQGKLFCVWSGKRLASSNLDVDHCFPWSVWPCGDLWNLMPSHRRVNQHEKRNLLPSDQILRSAQDRILEWWNIAYQKNENTLLIERFKMEADASLPTIASEPSELEDVFAAVNLKRVRLKHDQQAPEWYGEKYLC